MRIAILGGSFDPIHKGHINIAKTALKKLPIDEVWLMPTLDSPFKKQQSASFSHRVNMVKLAIRPYRHMRVCTLEGERSTRSYTIDTVIELKRRYPMHCFSWLIGDDQAKQFDAWKDHDKLLQEISFYVFSREDHVTLDARFTRVIMPLIPVSSSMIRKGKQLEYVADTVRTYIGKHGLYIEDMIASHMSEKRFAHSLSVAKLCVELAHAHHLDEQTAYLSGIIHDVCKELSYEQQRIWMKYHMPDNLEEAPAIWHGYIGSYYAKHALHIRDNNILRSIFHHVKGRNCNEYERILYIADKLDPYRGYDSSKQIALSKQSLTLGYELVSREQAAYLKKSGVNTNE